MDSLNEKTVRLEILMPLIKAQLAQGRTVRFSPRGVSMLPMLRQGIDSVVLAPLPDALKKYDLPLYQRENGQYVLHRIVEAGDTYTCLGDHQFQKEYGIKPEQMIAIVTAFYRGEKKHTISELGYKIYCRVWYHSCCVRKCVSFAIRQIRRIVR